ncbi:Separase [Phytophthora palmivora]|uniref:Separase n=1 Tax=Phytophthora palmivora TaxID=4796 RepID=A0A2P4XJU0_9STRA|nr:Separase [Phytophthora palmivora]
MTTSHRKEYSELNTAHSKKKLLCSGRVSPISIGYAPTEITNKLEQYFIMYDSLKSCGSLLNDMSSSIKATDKS